MRYEVKFTSQFKRDLKLAKKQGKDTEKLFEVVERLANGEILEERYRDHDLTGNYKGCRECHIDGDVVHAFVLRCTVPAEDPVGVIGDIAAHGVHHLGILQGRSLTFGLLQRLGVGFGEDLADGIVYRADVFHDLRVIVEDGLLSGVRRVQAAEDHRWEQRDEKYGQGQQGDSHDCQFLFEGLHSFSGCPRKPARCRALGDVGDCLAYFGGALHLLGGVQDILQAAGLSVIWHG